MRAKSVLFIAMIILNNGCNKNDHPQFQGYVEGENIFLASPYNGILKELYTQRGQYVEKGKLLFKLDPNPQLMNIALVQGELDQAKNILIDLEKPRRDPEISAIEAQIEQANSQIQLAELRVDRLQKLYNKKFTDKDSLDAAIANLQLQHQLKQQYESNLALAKLGGREDQIKAQKAQINSLSAKLNEVKWELAQKSISAPANGIIFDTYYRVGEFVAIQQPVLSLLTPENVRIEFFVPLDYIAHLQVGQKISFDCDGCEKSNNAIISYISPEAEYVPPLVYSRENYSKLVFRIKAHIQNATLFKPGQPVTVTL